MEITIKTKYDLNQLVYVLNNNKIVLARIIDVFISVHNLNNYTDENIKYYLVNADCKTDRLGYYRDNDIFDTKKELLESL